MKAAMKIETDDSERILALLDPLYDAATDPELWGLFLQKASEVLRARTAGIIVHDPENARTGVNVDLGLTEEMRRDIEQLAGGNPWIQEIQKHKAEGWYSGAVEDILPMEMYRKSEFYNEFHRKYKIEWAAATTVFFPNGLMPSFVVSRPKSDRPFSVADKELLKQLVPHLKRVFKVHREVTALRERDSAGQYALDLLGAACVTLDGAGRVLAMNRRAETMIAERGTLRIMGKRLFAASSTAQNELAACVFAACACGEGRSKSPGAGAVVLRSPQGSPLYVSVLPYRSDRPVLDGRPAALLFITADDAQGAGEHRSWHAMFGFSPAECRVAEMMKQGLEVAEISDAMRIKAATVRYYQKSIYRKTGMRGQAQLMRLLSRLPASSL
ncbi:MAG: hypothetical protein CXZ00_13715 [Acidobacteria bacterium]|nr:MAG: hypothetical protein CXZ00_13715 [Acidobacteriota bacterium]